MNHSKELTDDDCAKIRLFITSLSAMEHILWLCPVANLCFGMQLWFLGHLEHCNLKIKGITFGICPPTAGKEMHGKMLHKANKLLMDNPLVRDSLKVALTFFMTQMTA